MGIGMRFWRTLLAAVILAGVVVPAGNADASRKEQIHRALLDIYQRQHRNTECKTEFNELLKLNPQDAGLHFSYAQFLERLGDSLAAGKQYQAATKIDPTTDEYWGQLGLFYMRSKAYNEALPALKRAGPRYHDQLVKVQQYVEQLRQYDTYNKELKRQQELQKKSEE